MNNQVTVSLEINPLQVVLNAPKGASEEEILNLAKEEALKQLQQKFPSLRYSITKGASLKLEECEPGIVVKYGEEDAYIFEVKPNRKFPVSIALAGGRKLQVKPLALEPVGKLNTINPFWNERPEFMKEVNEWAAGDNAYIPVKDKVQKVIIGKVTKASIHAYELGTTVRGKYMPIKPNQRHFLCDTEEQAKKFLK